MKNIALKTLKYLAFFAIGILIFWLMYRDIEWPKLIEALKGLKYHWLIVSIVLGLLSQLSRALRWKLLMKPMGYNPALSNTFLSILVLYFVNLIVPRAGEVARCAVLTGTDRVPFTKLVGTVFIERLADTLMLLILAIAIFAMNLEVVTRFFDLHPESLEKLRNLLSLKYIFLMGAIILFLIWLFIFLRKKIKGSSKREKIIALKNQIVEGMRSILNMKDKWLFIGHTCFIFLMWLFMLYVVFLAYGPTHDLSVRTGMVVFLMGGLAMLAPIQGGIGPWHFMVAETLLLYGLEIQEGEIFALIAHTTTNLIYIVLGGSALIFLIVKYGNKTIRLRSK